MDFIACLTGMTHIEAVMEILKDGE